MTVISAREQLEKIGDPFGDGYCIPLAIDSLLRHTALPEKWYQNFSAANEAQSDDFDGLLGTFIMDFYGVKPNPQTETASMAHYNAFGASVQDWCPDVPYSYTEELKNWQFSPEVSHKQLRLQRLLRQAQQLNCITLCESFDDDIGWHVVGLESVDPTGLYIVRDASYAVEQKIYHDAELSGLM